MVGRASRKSLFIILLQVNDDITDSHFPSIVGLAAFAFVPRPDVSTQFAVFAYFVQNVLCVICLSISLTSSGSFTRSGFITCVCMEFIAFCSHKMTESLYLLSSDILDA